MSRMKFRVVRLSCLLAAACLALVPVPAHAAPAKKARPTATPTPVATPDPEMLTAQSALYAYFSGNPAALQKLYFEALAREKASGKSQGVRPSDSMLYLFNSGLTDRDRYLIAQEAAAREATSPELRTRILLSLLEDEYYEINQLKGQDRFNKFTHVFNRASSSLSKLAMFQPQDAAQLMLDAAYGVKKARDTSDRERKMLHLGREFLTRYPSSPDAAEITELMSQLRAKEDQDAATRETLAGRTFLEKKQFAPARFHLENAQVLKPTDAEIAGLLAELSAAEKQADEAESQTVSVGSAETALTRQQAGFLGEACRAVLRGDSPALNDIATSAPEMAGSIAYANASLLESSGQHDRALAALTQISQTMPQDPVGLRSAGVLRNPSFNLDEQFDAAVARMKEEQRKYILTGKRTADENMYVAGSTAIQATGQAASGLPFLFLTDVLVRGFAEQFKTQMDIDEVVDAGAAYIRRYPGSPRSRQIASSIATLASKGGDYARSEEYMDEGQSGTPEQRSKIRNNRARKIYDNAMACAELCDRRRALVELSDKYSDCKITAQAKKELLKIPSTLEPGGVVLSRKALQRDAALVSMIGLDPQFIDGNARNNEVTDYGVAIDAAGKRFGFRLKDVEQDYVYPVPAARQAEIVSRAHALRDVTDSSTAGDDMVKGLKVPFAVEGGAGGSGVELAPKLIPPKDIKDAPYYK